MQFETGIHCSGKSSGLRIDKFLTEICPDYTRSFLQKLLKSELVEVNGKPVKSSYKTAAGDTVNFEVPEAVEAEITAQEMPLDILYEDEDVILINKPKGMVVHPAAGHYEGTLVNGLMHHCREQLSGINGVMRPGIVHRIDMDTTGVLIVCKNDLAHNSIAEQLKVHSITRKYYAVVFGSLKDDEGTIHAPIGRHPNDRKKMSINSKTARTPSPIIKCCNVFTDIHSWSAGSKQDARTRSGFTWQASDIRFWRSGIWPGETALPFTGQTLHAGVPVSIRAQESIWSFQRRCQNILRNCLRNCAA